jgi:hypothetical protein
MKEKLKSCGQWLPHHLYRSFGRQLKGVTRPRHIYLAICDHFEPYWRNADRATARRRLQRWLDEYPKIADRLRDDDDLPLKYSFFYPEEEYRREDLDALSELCHAGFGEVEVHLHHDNDTSANLRRTLLDYKRRLHEDHGLLSVNRNTGEIAYGFIHGNWALDNSRPDGRWCGVNDEITILQETGCYADFTMPSAPSVTQTRKVNSIYYAVDDAKRPKSHDWGRDARVAMKGNGLLMVQGPLTSAWHNRKWGLFPRIENSGLTANTPISRRRVRCWIDVGVQVQGAPDHVFIKLYTHGTQEKNMAMFFEKGGMARLLELVKEEGQRIGAEVHFVSAREMVNLVHALETRQLDGIDGFRNQRYVCRFYTKMKKIG